MSLRPHWSHGVRKAPAFSSQTKPALKAADLHFPQMMQVGAAFAAEHRKEAGGLISRQSVVLTQNQAVTVQGGASFLPMSCCV